MQLLPFELERYFEGHEFDVSPLLCTSDVECASAAEVLADEAGPGKVGALERLLGLRLGYGHRRGSRELREAIAATYAGIEPDQVLVHSSSREAPFAFLAR